MAAGELRFLCPSTSSGCLACSIRSWKPAAARPEPPTGRPRARSMPSTSGVSPPSPDSGRREGAQRLRRPCRAPPPGTREGSPAVQERWGAPRRWGKADQAPGLRVRRALSLSPSPFATVPKSPPCPQKRLSGVCRVLLETGVFGHSALPALVGATAAQFWRWICRLGSWLVVVGVDWAVLCHSGVGCQGFREKAAEPTKLSQPWSRLVWLVEVVVR